MIQLMRFIGLTPALVKLDKVQNELMTDKPAANDIFLNFDVTTLTTIL